MDAAVYLGKIYDPEGLKPPSVPGMAALKALTKSHFPGEESVLTGSLEKAITVGPASVILGRLRKKLSLSG